MSNHNRRSCHGYVVNTMSVLFGEAFGYRAEFDQDNINAEMSDGVITLVLPKVEEAKPRRIEVRTG